jgi:hypothetical protein
VLTWWKIETGLEYGSLLPRKLIIKAIQGRLAAVQQHKHSISRFYRQINITFESCFDFPNQLHCLKTHKDMQRQKTIRRANQRQ